MRFKILRRSDTCRSAVKALRLERPECPLNPPAPAFRQLVFTRSLSKQARHHVEIKRFLVRAADTGLECLRTASGFGMGERRTQNVPELDNQPSNLGAEIARLFLVRGLPCLGDQLSWRLTSAIHHRTIDLDRARGMH